MFAALTGLGLSTAAGFNAYIPLLVVGVAANLTDKVSLPSGYEWMERWWALLAITVLLLVEVVVDKVPVADHVNDVIQTAVRPAAGGAVFSATAAAAEVDRSAWMTEHPWVGWVVGIVTALAVHLVKATVRPVVNATTAGVGAPVVSTVEDGGSLGMSLIAVFLPVLVIVALIVLIWLAIVLVRKVRRRKRRKAAEREAKETAAAAPPMPPGWETTVRAPVRTRIEPPGTADLPSMPGCRMPVDPNHAPAPPPPSPTSTPNQRRPSA